MDFLKPNIRKPINRGTWYRVISEKNLNENIEVIGDKDASLYQIVVKEDMYEIIIQWETRTITVYRFKDCLLNIFDDK